MGYALIHGTEGQTPSFTLADVVVLTKIRDPYARLARIHEVVVSLIQSYHVTELAIEAPFYGKNAQSMLKLTGRSLSSKFEPRRSCRRVSATQGKRSNNL